MSDQLNSTRRVVTVTYTWKCSTEIEIDDSTTSAQIREMIRDAACENSENIESGPGDDVH